MGIPEKGGLGHSANLKGGLGKKEGAVFLRAGVIPQCTLCTWSHGHISTQHQTTYKKVLKKTGHCTFAIKNKALQKYLNKNINIYIYKHTQMHQVITIGYSSSLGKV